MRPKDSVSKENVVGAVYKIKCEECEVTYISQTERSLKSRLNKHRRPSSITSEVSKHIHIEHPEHSVELENTEILTTESRWFERGVKEAIYIRALNPSLNRDGGRYNLPPVWDIIKKRVKTDRPSRGGGACFHHHHRPMATAPQETDQADRSEQKLSYKPILWE